MKYKLMKLSKLPKPQNLNPQKSQLYSLFVDKTSTDIGDKLRKYGYNVMILDYKLTQDTINPDEIKDFIGGLLTMLMNFKRMNPNSIVINF